MRRSTAIKLAVSAVLYFLVFYLLFFSRTTAQPPYSFPAAENKQFLLGFYCYSNQTAFINIFQAMLGAELGKLNYPLNKILVFCYRGTASSYPSIHYIYYLLLLNKTTLIVHFVPVQGYNCTSVMRRIGNINFITLYIGQQLPFSKQKYCIAWLVYSITKQYFLSLAR
ncbi:MAG: hypothetical protein GXO42_01240 [bacterium]|nr:hypothetical protein [bacterium]